MAEERTRAFILATMFFWEGEVGEVLRVCASFFLGDEHKGSSV